jgi:RNA polymerase sigma factor (sigma-70 family)
MTVATRNARLDAEIITLIPILRRFARTLHKSQNDADDLVQDTLTKGLANLDKFEEGTRLQSWMFTIMRNTFCSRYAVAKREHVGITDVMAFRMTVQADQDWALRGREMQDAIRELPDQYRAALNFVLIQGGSYDDAAKHFDCPVGTVKSRVSQARDKLQSRLDS